MKSKYFLSSKVVLLTFVAVAASTVAGAAVLLTPGTGIISAAVKARAHFLSPTDIKIKVKDGREEVIDASNAADTVVQEIIIGPGGATGWHSHPGPVVVLVKSGSLTFYDGDDPTCSGTTYNAGEAFIDRGQGHVHIARNESTTQNLELWATYFDVPSGGAFRIDMPAPGNCSF